MFESEKFLLNETVKKIYTPHKIVYISLGIQLFFFIVVVAIGIYFFPNKYYGFFIVIILLQGFFVYVYFRCMQYELSKIIITNQRLLGFERISFFEYNFFSIFLDDIKEMKGVKKGFFENTFDYGTIIIVTKNLSNHQYILKNIAQNMAQTKMIYELLVQYKKDFNKM